MQWGKPLNRTRQLRLIQAKKVKCKRKSTLKFDSKRRIESKVARPGINFV
jgi:hypothetical protein